MLKSATACAEISLKLAMKDNVYGDVTSKGGLGFFNSTEPSSWKGMCKFYSGNADCKPHKDILMISSNIRSAIYNTTNFSNLPAINNQRGMTRVNAVELMSICSDQADKIETCEQIKVSDYYDGTSEDKENFEWESFTEHAKCQEVGYYYNLKCKQNPLNENECVSAENCADFLSGLDKKYHVADAFCRDVFCARNTSNMCEDYVADKMDSQYLMKDVWNNESLLDIHKKCQLNKNQVMDIIAFESAKMDFDITDNGEEPVCKDLTDMDYNSANDQIRCQMLGAFKGEFTEYNKRAKECAQKAEGSCDNTSFSLPLFYDNSTQNSPIEAARSPIPSRLDNMFVEIDTVLYEDFGSVLCNALNCDSDVREGSDFKCKSKSQCENLDSNACPKTNSSNCPDELCVSDLNEDGTFKACKEPEVCHKCENLDSNACPKTNSSNCPDELCVSDLNEDGTFKACKEPDTCASPADSSAVGQLIISLISLAYLVL